MVIAESVKPTVQVWELSKALKERILPLVLKELGMLKCLQDNPKLHIRIEHRW